MNQDRFTDFFGVLLLAAIGVGGSAMAFSRIVIVVTEPVTIAMDGMPAPAAIGNRTTLQAVPAGAHTFSLFSSNGQSLHQETVTVPDNADVHISWSTGGNFVVTGATASGAQAGGVNYRNDTATGVVDNRRNWTNGTGGTTSTGSLGPASGPRATDLLAGDGTSGMGSSGQHGRNAQSLTGARGMDGVLNAGVGGFQAMTYGAQAGTSFGSDGQFRQQIKKANVVYGMVVFNKLGGPPVRIYTEGMLVAELGAGAQQVDSKLEVGRRPLEFRSAVDHGVWWSGDLILDRSHVIQLVFDDRTPPKPQVRPWLWQGI
jgi:hypothetical protein